MRSHIPRIAIFVIYFWFGALKLFGVSPAEQLVIALHQKLIFFIPFGTFYTLLGIGECVLGILFLLTRYTRLASYLFGVHMIAVFSSLLFLPSIAWSGLFIPTLEGQYVIKNLALIALVWSLQPFAATTSSARPPASI